VPYYPVLMSLKDRLAQHPLRHSVRPNVCMSGRLISLRPNSIMNTAIRPYSPNARVVHTVNGCVCEKILSPGPCPSRPCLLLSHSVFQRRLLLNHGNTRARTHLKLDAFSHVLRGFEPDRPLGQDLRLDIVQTGERTYQLDCRDPHYTV